WKLVSGGKYYVKRAETAILAFIVGSKPLVETGVQMAASHIDSPSLKLKPATVKTEACVTRVGVEVYGGPILSTWIDRELGIAGRVTIKNSEGYHSVPVNIDRPLAIIPNAAIHINRDLNDGFKYNKQIHLQAILATGSEAGNPLLSAVAAHLDLSLESIREMELFLYDLAKASLTGTDETLIVSGRLDNLAMTHAILSALVEAQNPQATCLAAFFDHEEIGSETQQGADSSLLQEVLERVTLALGIKREEHLRAMHRSFLISADMAHAFHPSYAEKYDRDYAPAMNQGPVIKINGNYRYTSTSESTLRFLDLCEAADIRAQKFMTRSDMPCGSTVGPVVSALLGIPAVDIGNPMWAMHSARETCGVKDHKALIKV
ncbi:MAG TPA: M18 family aminopeptidase, partial [Candidatus Cloacimonadota bacterium]|nr:M18 family aminopeptidase [Candidatus Cloacimonadota bacterium]